MVRLKCIDLNTTTMNIKKFYRGVLRHDCHGWPLPECFPSKAAVVA